VVLAYLANEIKINAARQKKESDDWFYKGLFGVRP
jgi:hypothetical protein